MSDFQVDLTNCDRELIQIPGQIQSHGFLIAIDDEYIIRFHSDNLNSFIKEISNNLIGQPIEYIESFIEKQQPDFLKKLVDFGKSNKSFEQTNPFQISIKGVSYYLIISTAPGFYVLEFEPVILDFVMDVQKMIGRSITEVLADVDLNSLLNIAAAEIKSTILYDRVMIYRFASDGHGEVVAEAKNEDLDSWKGLHYPASDIPKQARELYKLNLTRLIADVHTMPSRISTAATNQQPLDLTNSQLRAVSPIHIQYLKNMGVASSFSISLLNKKELWGLIACHNYSPRSIDFKSRESSKLIGQILSSALVFRQDKENHEIYEIYKNYLDQLTKQLQESDSIEEALINKQVNLLNAVNASGAVLLYQKKMFKLGTTPDDAQLTKLFRWIKESEKDALYFTSSLSEEHPEAGSYRKVGSGMLLSVLSKELEEYIIWFKPEFIQTIKWAGNPEKPVEINANGFAHISPRHSFDAWSQTVSGKSDSWGAEEIKSAMRLKAEIMFAVNLKAAAIRLLNEKLIKAYEELDTFSFTISHDLKNPISAIKGYSQLLERDKTISEFGKTLVKSITERINKMNLMINEVLEYSRIGRSDEQFKNIDLKVLINEVIKDLDQVYLTDNLKITVAETPDLHGDMVMMNQVFSNLIGNAVKYSRGSNPALIHVSGEVNGSEIRYTIQDNGLGIEQKNLTKIFELFNRMENAKYIEGSGVGLAIVKRIVDKHKGRIWAESEIGRGTTFYVCFNKAV
ncbi:MAG: GAF domain-containing protein [Flavobacterium sp.]|nr:GAF domain-containing protein [Pedobacter sp.]